MPAAVAGELKSQDGLLSSTPTTILVLGTDGGTQPGRGDSHRSDSVMLIRTDPGKHRLAFLSIPRDLRVEIPGHGTAKLNAASQYGGPALTLKTVKDLTGLNVNHIAVINFDRFKELIDAVGGIDVDVPRPIVSNNFDCPYASDAKCEEWQGWHFGKGVQHMSGQRALIYSRIRENRLDPSETDLDRARRQQQVFQATANKVTSFGTALKLPFTGAGIVKPLDDRSHRRPGARARLGVLPRGHEPRAPLSPRRRARHRRRPVGHLRIRGQRGHDRDVHRPLRATRAAEGSPLRAGLHGRRPPAVSRAQSAAAVFLSPEPESFAGSFLSPPCRSSRSSRRRHRPSTRSCATPCRSRSSRSPSPCNAPRRETAPFPPGSRRRPRSSRPGRRSSSGRARTGGRSGNGTRRSASGRPIYQRRCGLKADDTDRRSHLGRSPVCRHDARVSRRPCALDRRRRDRSSRDAGSCSTS